MRINITVEEHPEINRCIDIPKSADYITILAIDTKVSSESTFLGSIMIPKKTVKKWQWKLGSLWYTREHYTEAEIRKRSNMKIMEKVEGSEIEVEV